MAVRFGQLADAALFRAQMRHPGRRCLLHRFGGTLVGHSCLRTPTLDAHNALNRFSSGSSERFASYRVIRFCARLPPRPISGISSDELLCTDDLFLRRALQGSGGRSRRRHGCWRIGFPVESFAAERMALRFRSWARRNPPRYRPGHSRPTIAFASGPPTVAAVSRRCRVPSRGDLIPLRASINSASAFSPVTLLRLRAGVSATMRTLIRGLVPIGALLGGLLKERIGLRSDDGLGPRRSRGLVAMAPHRYARSGAPPRQEEVDGAS